MHRCSMWLPIAALLVTVACGSGRHSSAGFRLPAGGSVEQGKAAFVALECHRCHAVSGVELPSPPSQPPVQVVLGGVVPYEMTDGYLVAAIVNPSYRLAHYSRDLGASGVKCRMPEYADRMTVRQLTDLVAFLQSRYTVRRISPKYPYY